MVRSHTAQKILVVDDSPVNLQILRHLLKDEWVVETAMDGGSALRIAHSDNPPDLILLDVMMPGMDGYTVCQQLKESEDTRDIPVVFVTALSDEREEARGLDLGAIDYITKPYSAPIVKARIRNHLELKQYRDLLKHMAMVDGLTGIANRRQFDEILPKEWKRAHRERIPISLLMVDVDHFREYNEAHGHLGGDECLREIARIIADSLMRPYDLAARYGGEEFVCLLPAIDEPGMMEVAERIRSRIQALEVNCLKGEASRVTVSVGGASLVPREETGWEDLVEQADRALYEAKNGGRNQVVCFRQPK